MSAGRRLIIHEVSRFPNSDPSDTLKFEDGVNVLVGTPNTGKSKWLRMLDFVLGDSGKPADVFSDDLAVKYNSIRAVLSVGGTTMVVVRQWDDSKLATKVQVDGEWTTLHSYSLKLLEALGIPVLHYPQGNPYGTRSWPELGWRGLFRHVYRRQLFWTDLADKQPESEQHACILQFVGIAERLFSKEYGELVTLEKRIQRLQDDRERFVETLQEVSRELINEKELGVALTPDSIKSAIARHDGEIEAFSTRKKAAIQSLRDSASQSTAEKFEESVTGKLGADLATARTHRASFQGTARRTQGRLDELMAYRGVVEAELGRLRRAAVAGNLLADLKITHCPACDRPITQPDEQNDQCYLCKRPNEPESPEAAEERLKFELQQLEGEQREANDLIEQLRVDLNTLLNDELKAAATVRRLEDMLRPATDVLTASLPPEFGIYDQNIGRLQERISQLRRIEATLAHRETIARDIEKIQTEVGDLEAIVAEQSKLINFESANDSLTDGMNTYLNAINAGRPNGKPWTQAGVDFRLREHRFNLRVGKTNWHTQLGGTSTLYLLLAYHYSLLCLTPDPEHHYPGICILDFPPEIEGTSISDSENFVLEPFVKLLQSGAVMGQVIAAGSSFDGLADANRIRLNRIWVG